MTNTRKRFLLPVGFLIVFILWTLALGWIDVQPIGPNGTAVGFATVNGYVHRLTGVCMLIYTITDWLGLVPVGIGFGFAIGGLVQWIRRKSIVKVDYSILVLGGFYLVVFAVYMLFESVVINRRPVLIDGFLEASYPSSTTMLVLCMMPTAAMQLKNRIRNEKLSQWICGGISVFILFMVIGRLISGVHWLSDIVGGVLISGGLVTLYRAVVGLK